MAPEFADSTSSMYNNITDYVLGPMHGHPYPTLSERPLPQPQAVIQDGCWLDDSDHPDDESSGSQAMPVTEVDSASSNSVEDDTKPFSLSRVDSQSVATLASQSDSTLQCARVSAQHGQCVKPDFANQQPTLSLPS